MSDVENDDRRFGKHPFVHYAELGLLGENCTFSHVNAVREDEISPIVANKVSIVWCPLASVAQREAATLNCIG